MGNIVSKVSYVSSISSQDIKIHCSDKKTKHELKRLGIPELLQRVIFHIKYGTQKELVDKLTIIRNIGIPFAGGPSGWPPAAMIDDLIEKKLFHGNYKEIIWSNYDQFFIYDVDAKGKRVLLENKLAK